MYLPGAVSKSFHRFAPEGFSFRFVHGQILALALPLFVGAAQAAGMGADEAPQLDRLDNGNLACSLDFRSVYATVLERWWGVGSANTLGGRFGTIDLVRA